MVLICTSACAGRGGPSVGDDPPARAIGTPIVGGRLDTTTKGVVALALAAHGQVAVFCSGSLIAPNLVLTARHCIAQIGDGNSEQVSCSSSEFTASYDPRQVFVSTDVQPQGGSKLYAVKEIRQAPGSTKVCGYDLALLILSGSVPSSAASPIEPALDASTQVASSFSAVGYGLQDPQDTKGTTAGSRMRFDGSSVYCVGSTCPASAQASADEFLGNSPVCSGDSGGPALDDKGRVFGVTSRGDAACTYALYSNVADWASFLRSTASDAVLAGGYSPPAWIDPATVASGSGGSSGMEEAAGNPGSVASSGSSPSSGGAASGNSGTAPPPIGSVAPTVDPTGASCAGKGDCPGTYQCYSATQTPPGMCVPSCTRSASSCPDHYACDQALGVCTPLTPTVTKLRGSASCTLSTTPEPGSSLFMIVLGLSGGWLGRRRTRA